MALYDLVFSAGGTKGVAFIGALEILENGKHQFARLLGSSAGAITATLVAVGGMRAGFGRPLSARRNPLADELAKNPRGWCKVLTWFTPYSTPDT